jgi:choice-of-anchor C domain-containing protein
MLRVHHIVSAVLALALLAGGFSEATANIITNGSFENSDSSVNPGGGFTTLGSGDTRITGWTVGGNSIDYIGGYWQASDGSRSLDMSGGNAGSISQTLATTAGTTYQVLFDLAGNTDGGNVIKKLRVSAAANTQDYSFDTTGKSHANMGWTTDSFLFTATGGSTTLTFTSLEPNAYGPALDNVRAEAVPEPGSLTLLAVGSLGLLGYARRRQRVIAPAVS